jgi:hypothetical protein
MDSTGARCSRVPTLYSIVLCAALIPAYGDCRGESSLLHVSSHHLPIYGKQNDVLYIILRSSVRSGVALLRRLRHPRRDVTLYNRKPFFLQLLDFS